MDLKVMPTSNRGYNYLLVMRCNNSRFIVTEALKTRQAKEVVEAIFQILYVPMEQIYVRSIVISIHVLRMK